MDILRLVLFAGLVFHKFVWEAMKIGGRAPSAPPRSSSVFKRLVKYAKSAVLIGLVIQTLFLDLFPISDRPAELRVWGVVLFAVGLAVAVVGRLQLGKNWANLEDYQLLQGQALVKTGLYQYVRHPIYTGDLLLLVGLELALNSWLVLGVLVPLIVVLRQTSAEELLLAKALDGYEEYRKNTKRFIPFVV